MGNKVKTQFGTLIIRGKVWHTYYKVAERAYNRESTGHTDLSKAKVWLEERFREVASAPLFYKIPKAQRSLTDLAVRYCNDKNSDRDILWYIKNIVAFFGHFDPPKIQTYDIERFRIHLNTMRKRNGEPFAVKSRNHHLRWLKAILRYGAQIGWYSIYNVPYIKISAKGETVRFRIPTDEEVQKLLFAAAPHVRLSVAIACFTGMRKGEILGLLKSKINIGEAFIYLSSQEVKERRPRLIPIITPLFPYLEGALKTPGEYAVNENGIRVQDIKTGFNAACRRAGIKDLHFHDLRHFACKKYLKAGVKIEVVRAILGHSTVNMTLQYFGLIEHDFKEANELVCTKFTQTALG